MGSVTASITELLKMASEGRSMPRFLDVRGLDEVRQAIGLIEAAGQAFAAQDYPTVKLRMEEASMLLQSAEARLAG